MIPDNKQLREFIVQAFSDEDFDIFCFDHFPELEQRFSVGMTKTRKAVDLIKFCQTRGQVPELMSALERERPLLWQERTTAIQGTATGFQARATLEGKPLETKTDRSIDAKTGIELIQVRTRPFLFGSADAEDLGLEDEYPLQWFELPEYWIARFPVTNTQYRRFIDANPHYDVPYVKQKWATPYNWNREMRTHPKGKGDHPVVLVSLTDVRNFCEWASLRLPSEPEWEKAARGDQDARTWPWGSDWVDGRCNTSEAGVGSTTPVGLYSPQSDSPYGCADMAGNVWEWTSGRHATSTELGVLRGGSWYPDRQFARVTNRTFSDPDTRAHIFGFRVATSVLPNRFQER